MPLSQLQPKVLWENFSKLNAIPRPSKREDKVIAFMKDFGEQLGLPTEVDEVGNVIIRKPATQGMEDRKSVIMQSHLDMVCQKNNDTVFDFEKEGIKMKVEGDWVKAEGTTLGADNGLGVAAIMSILESKDIPHPAIEALFTIDEETGMTGALGLKPGQLTGDILLNLDTEEDDSFSIGCAGGIDVTGSKNYAEVPAKGTSIRIEVKGLQGGHSGMDIHKGLGNANIILARFLALAKNEAQLVQIDGGGLRNAIPREAHAVLVVPDAEDFLQKAESLKKEVEAEFSSLESQLKIEFSKTGDIQKALSPEDSTKIIAALQALHNGVYRMSPDIAGLVEASNNVARVELKEGALKILCLTRSSVNSTKWQVVDELASVFKLAEMNCVTSGDYPGWKPKTNASILKSMQGVYEKLFADKPHVEACHAGLECGIIGAHYPEMEMISFGPTIKGAHSPDEKASISSVQKFWSFLQEVLANIPKK